MKILIISLICALAGGVAGSVQAWGTPHLYSGAVVRTFIPPQIKGFAYSTSQYINSVPSAAYSVGLQPQLTYQVPAVSALTPVHTAYYPAPSPSIYPTNVFFATVPGVAPAIPSAPVIPSNPAPIAPESPSQTNPGSDTTVVESADQTQSQESSANAPTQSGQPSRPVSTFPNFPSIPQMSQLQDVQQDSQFSFPPYPQAPANDDYSQGPGSAPPSFLGGNGGDKGINDEDTVSVESA